MSSRQEEKAQRKRERLAAEEAARRSASRGKRIRLVAVGALVALAAAGGVFAIATGGGESGSGSSGPEAAIPAQKISDLDEAARAADCKLQSPKDAGSEHTTEPVQYDSNPPTSGSHDPVAAQDGIYAQGNPPDVEASVHALEHGRINIQYRAGSGELLAAQLETLANEDVRGQAGYHVLLFENQTGMRPAVAATAWTQSLTCATVTDATWDALRAFRDEYVDKGPEFIP